MALRTPAASALPVKPAMTSATRLRLEPAPALALLAAMGGGAMLTARRRRDGSPRPVALIAGLTLLGFAVHRPLSDALRRAGASRRSANLHFSFVVARPVEDVFRFCANFENFPRFISALREVRDGGDGRSHWCSTTPTGHALEWDAITTKYVTNSVIGWESVQGAPVEASGVLRFSPDGDGTCVRVAMAYAVRESSLADALAALVTPRRAHALETEIRRLETAALI
jgi:uncharacterized membrane protein